MKLSKVIQHTLTGLEPSRIFSITLYLIYRQFPGPDPTLQIIINASIFTAETPHGSIGLHQFAILP